MYQRLGPALRALGAPSTHYCYQCFPSSFRRFADFCNRLHLRASRLTIWAASVLRDRIPTLMQEVILTEPLRTPPSVTAEVQRSDRLRKGRVHSYTDPRSPLPSVGPAPLYLYHTDEHGALGPIECRQCGLELAKLLKEELQVGVCTGV